MRSEHRGAEAALQASNQRLASILENVSDAVVALDKDWRYTYVNAKAGQIFHRQPADLLGKHIWAEFPESVGRASYHAYHRAMAEQVFVELEEYYPPCDQWIESRIYPAPDGLSIFFHDISERKRTYEALLQSEQRYRVLANNFPNAMVLLFDRNLRYLLVEGTELTEVGMEKEMVEGRLLHEVFPPDTCALLEPDYRAALAGDTRVSEMPFGNRLYERHTRPVRDAHGKIVGGMVMSQNDLGV